MSEDQLEPQNGDQQPENTKIPNKSINTNNADSGMPNGYYGQRDLPNLIMAFVLSGVALVSNCFCGLVSIGLAGVAFYLANQDIKKYENNPDAYTKSSYDNMKIAKICALVVLILSALLFIVSFVFIGGAAMLDVLNEI